MENIHPTNPSTPSKRELNLLVLSYLEILFQGPSDQQARLAQERIDQIWKMDASRRYKETNRASNERSTSHEISSSNEVADSHEQNSSRETSRSRERSKSRERNARRRLGSSA